MNTIQAYSTAKVVSVVLPYNHFYITDIKWNLETKSSQTNLYT